MSNRQRQPDYDQPHIGHARNQAVRYALIAVVATAGLGAAVLAIVAVLAVALAIWGVRP